MDKLYCKLCNEELVNGHTWKKHRIKEADYFHIHEPRYSKQTGELIRFKSRDFYLNSDFNDKREMMTWFKNNPIEAKSYGLGLLQFRISKKKLLHAPSQVELRSLMMPSMLWYKKEFGSYANACNMVGGPTPRFDREDNTIAYSDFLPRDMIVIDSREQYPLKFANIHTEVMKLEYGDYALSPNKYKVHIERKNLSDFVGTMSIGYERFCREVERAKKDKAYLIVLIESTLNDALHFNYLPQTKYCKASPDYIFHQVREILQKYSNLQLLFCDGRREAAELVQKIFKIKKHPKHWDLQYQYDIKQL